MKNEAKIKVHDDLHFSSQWLERIGGHGGWGLFFILPYQILLGKWGRDGRIEKKKIGEIIRFSAPLYRLDFPLRLNVFFI